MIFFTPKLLHDGGSVDADVTVAAHTAWEKGIIAYKTRLQTLDPCFNQTVRQLANLNLHDAEVVARFETSHSYNLLIKPEYQEFFWLIEYHLAQPKELIHHDCIDEDTPLYYWLYDEIDIQNNVFVHSILFSKGTELTLRFSSVSLTQMNTYCNVTL